MDRSAACALAAIVLTVAPLRAGAEDAAAPKPPAPAPPPSVELSGYFQADVIPWDEGSADELGADGAPLNQERAMIRRGRLRATVERDVYFAHLELDGNTVSGPVARIVGAQVGTRWRDRARDVDARLSVGVFKIPFGREVPAPEAERPVLEPSTAARALFPGNYDGGLLLAGRWRVVELSAAWTNGAPSGDLQYRGRDPSSSWDAVGRAGARGELAGGVTLGGGVSVLRGRGFHAGTAPAASQTFERSAIGADVELGWCLCVVGKGRVSAELALASNLDRGVVYADPVAAGRDLRELGWYVQVVQELTRHGQVAARYDEYRPDRDAPAGMAEPRYRTVSVAAEVHRERARLLVQYEHEERPTRATSRVTLRAQVRF